MGPKQRVRKDNYWDSGEADKDREEAEKLHKKGQQQSDSDSDSDDIPISKKKPTSKFAPVDESSSESEESSSEEEVQKKPSKPAAKQSKKVAPTNNKKKPVVESSSSEEEESESESEESSEEDTKKKPSKPAAKQSKKVAPTNNNNNKKKPVVESSSEESESESEESSSEEDTKKKPSKPAAKQNKKAPAKKAAAVESSSESEEESSSSEEEEKPTKPTQNNNNKKNNAKKPPAAKPSAAKQQAKKPAPKKPEEPEVLSGFLLKQRQEEERIAREKEEKRIREEEEKKRAAEQKIIDDEKARLKSIENSKKRAEKKEKQAGAAAEADRMAKLAKLGVNISAVGEKKEKSTNKTKSGGKKQNQVSSITESVEKLKIEEPTSAPKDDVVEVMDSWDNDDYETVEEIQKKKEEEAKRKEEEEEAQRLAAKEEKKKAKAAAAAAAAALIPTTDPTTTFADKSYRSPIICILGHVDTGKTSLLDKIRNTNVQGGEARGITQQIGASFIPVDAIKEQTKSFAEKIKMDFKLPGLLLIDTPGHESFNNLRSRGSGLCDLAILVIDIMHGLQAQTLESINLLRMRKTPFIVALNKVDRIYDWKPCVNTDFKEAYKIQSKSAAQEFDYKVKDIIAALAGQELNAELYWRNKDHRKYVSLVPTSANTGEGISDLMLVVIQLMQKLMLDKVEFTNQLQCTLLEVKVIEGFGTTIDVVLVNGTLNEGDKIVVSGFNGPIETSIRSLLTPPPLRESRVKSQFINHKSIRAAMGIKIVAPGLEKAVPGTSLHVVGPNDDIEKIRAEAKREVDSVLNDVETSGIGVSVQASTLGSLEAFLNFLKKIKIPVANVAIGPVHKKHIMNASIMLDKDPKYAILLAFDVKIEESAIQAANEMKVQVLSDETIYLFEEKLKKHFGAIKEKLRAETASICVWPCILEVTNVFRNSNPILVGVRVKEGTLRIGTPICVPESNCADVGKVIGIKLNEKDVTLAKKDDVVSVAIDDNNTKTTIYRHFDDKKQWMSKITRESLDALKEGWSEDLTKQDIQLLKFMKTVYKIQ
ncbi:eukaryotic translation initiation factor 5B [Dictyostelium discoideum AX4]|uniref:Eukaryotic translation initiation factor 5B n=1 Tax=Dictyostelium discoideum TaxID=44689 RepID=IF2P_DICDI|nr:eukaryotic translation initiation factor 5B [Dictyostelium discoideum AX4]Q54XP6.1 RecName: Full=Eukaryotic translation initiation factor 5B; Short=eIF-5B; AltName: Full=Translation initiation factor IF-2 [Dictyostelium discoideum]EAL68009.1 eukaryotic translation initiation factor 5B [Dictyostelium discoideum AX4]|eukprot:XP_641984.1 eukaryotic translation initiation factor 5B [Dictyostelium discoideum AX4]